MIDEKIKGKWIIERNPSGKAMCFHCSECDSDFKYVCIKTAYQYCPRCGSKMDNSQVFEKNEVE